MGSPEVVVVAAVVMREGRYLVCLRPAHKRHGGLWEFPGGKLHNGESLEDAVRRELLEELGLIVTRTGAVLFEQADPGSPFLIRFVEVDVNGDPVPNEHDRLAWATVSELAELPLAPTDSRFAESLLNQST